MELTEKNRKKVCGWPCSATKTAKNLLAFLVMLELERPTLVKFIINALNLDPELNVAYCTFTGKASEVLRNKGCPNACTAHKLLYYSKQLANGKFVHRPRPSLENPFYQGCSCRRGIYASLKSYGELLLKHDVYILACGDPFQATPYR